MPGKPRTDWGAAFAAYAATDPVERSYQRLADQLGVAKRTVERAAHRDGWTERLARLDGEVQRRAEARAVRDRADRVNDTLRIIDAARTRFAGQLAHSDFRLTGSDFVGLVKLEQLLEGQATDHVALVEVQAGLRTSMQVAIATCDAVLEAAGLPARTVAELSKAFRSAFLPAVNEALAIGGGSDG